MRTTIDHWQEALVRIFNPLILVLLCAQAVCGQNVFRIANADSIGDRIANPVEPASVLYPKERGKTVNDIYLRTAAIGSYQFDEADKNTLLSIANQCPLAGGNAVYKARALYALTSHRIYNDYATCAAGGYQMKRGEEATATQQPMRFLLYPNPATDEFSLAWQHADFVEGSLELIDALGRVVTKEKLLPGLNHAEISTKRIAQGVYYVRVCFDGQFVFNRKLIIIQ